MVHEVAKSWARLSDFTFTFKWLVVENAPASAGDMRVMDSILGSRRSPGGGHGNPLQDSCLENPRGQRSLVGYSPYLAKSGTQLKRLGMHACMDYYS